MLPRLTPRKQEHRHLCMICVTQTSQHCSPKPGQGTFTDLGGAGAAWHILHVCGTKVSPACQQGMLPRSPLPNRVLSRGNGVPTTSCLTGAGLPPTPSNYVL